MALLIYSSIKYQQGKPIWKGKSSLLEGTPTVRGNGKYISLKEFRNVRIIY